MQSFRKSVSGQGLAEYMLLLLLIALVVVIAMLLIGPEVGGALSDVGTTLNN